MTDCPAYQDYAAGDYPSVHNCADPVACALSAHPDSTAEELNRLRAVLDEVRELISKSTSKLAVAIRSAVDS